MTEIFIDYSAAKLSGSAVAAASFNGTPITGAIRYVDDPRLAKTKHTTPAEYSDLVAHGIKVRLVFEVGTNDSAGGRAAGVAYAQRALAGANALGYTGVIYFCNDQTTLASVANWQAYLDGAASVLGLARVGAYGFRNAIDAAWGHASAYWQCGAQSALQIVNGVPRVNIYQWNNGNMTISGIACDVNYVYSDYVPAQSANDPVTNPDQEYEVAQIPAGTNVIAQVPTMGRNKLYMQAGFGNAITGKMWFVADTKPGVAGGTYVGELGQPVAIDSDRPGPIVLPNGVRVVSLQVSCAIPFTAWTE